MSIVQSALPCPDLLGDDLKAQFARDGYLAFSEVLSPQEIEATKDALRRIVEHLRHHKKVLRSPYGQLWTDPDRPGLNIGFEKSADPTGDDDPDLESKIRKYSNYVEFDEFMQFLAFKHPKIQGVLSGLIGEKPHLEQNIALVKPAHHGSEKPWHQDDAYFKVVPLEAVCGVWLALDEATAENGCMFVLRGGHKIGALQHYHGADCEIVPDRLMGDLDPTNAIPIPLPPGGALFFSGILPHQTPANRSDKSRRALQFHYRSRYSRVVPDAEYDQVFIEADGTPASCRAAARRG